jgi:hypothetical protein
VAQPSKDAVNRGFRDRLLSSIALRRKKLRFLEEMSLGVQSFTRFGAGLGFRCIHYLVYRDIDACPD